MFRALPAHGFLLVSLIKFLSALPVTMAATYYVDSAMGDDLRSGTELGQSWKSLERVNQHPFQPGDRLLFKAGSCYRGQLRPQGSGAIVSNSVIPIRIDVYGDGPKPRIDADGEYADALLMRNVEFWEVANLEITNTGTNRAPWRTGVRVFCDAFGRMRHIRLRDLYVHDVNGDLDKSREGCGIYFETRGGSQSHFDDLQIVNCHVVRTDRNGICQRTSGGTRSRRVIIRGNLLEDIGGDGIKLWGSNGALVEGNVVRGGRIRCRDKTAGIWPFACDDAVIQFNEVSGMKGIKDGQGFDSDYQCRGSLFQYNYSHDNEGGFFLICGPGNSYNENTIIRYNISQNDGINSARVFHFGGGAKNTLIYNNTIYVSSHQNLPLILCTDWNNGNASGTRFFNNIFYVDGQVTYDWGRSTNTVFEHNVFFGWHVGPPVDAHGSTNRPPLANPGSGGPGIESLSGYKFITGHKPLRGRVIPSNGGRDFFGGVVSATEPPRVGAAE